MSASDNSSNARKRTLDASTWNLPPQQDARILSNNSNNWNPTNAASTLNSHLTNANSFASQPAPTVTFGGVIAPALSGFHHQFSQNVHGTVFGGAAAPTTHHQQQHHHGVYPFLDGKPAATSETVAATRNRARIRLHPSSSSSSSIAVSIIPQLPAMTRFLRPEVAAATRTVWVLLI